MATYVLVHGGGHGGWCYGPVGRLLRAAGHLVHAPTLTGLGDRRHLLNPDIDLDTHVTDIVQFIEHENLRDVVLAGHSYGGTVITGVADRITERIGHLVYLDAPVPKNGKSLADIVGEPFQHARAQGRVVDGVELVLWPGEPPTDWFGITDPAAIAWMKPRLTPHPWKTFEQALHLANEAAIRRIPQTYIACAERMKDMAREAIANADDGRLWELDTGHELMITEPEKVAEMLLSLAR